MEASENPGEPMEGFGRPGLQRIDLERVRATLRDPANATGYARLGLMLDRVLPRLSAVAPRPNQNGR